MKLDETDLEQSFFEPAPKAVDKSIGYVVIGLAVMLFFSMFLFGMYRVQNASDQVVGDHSKPLDESAPEISDRADSSKD